MIHHRNCFLVLVTWAITTAHVCFSLAPGQEDVDANNINNYEAMEETAEEETDGTNYGSYDQYGEEIDDEMQTWRRILGMTSQKLKTADPSTTLTPETAIRRSIVVATPQPPVPPNVEDIEAIRQKLQGKHLEDTIFSNNTHFKMAVAAFSSSDVTRGDDASRDLQTAICMMDCSIASATKMSAGFRGKDALRVQEESLERQWNNMTEIEKEFINAVTDANITRRASRGFTTTFQMFSEWCTENCQQINKTPITHGGKKRHSKRRRNEKDVTTEPPHDDSEYDSEESDGEKGMRRSEDDVDTKGNSVTDVTSSSSGSEQSYSLKIPLPQIIRALFGAKTVTSLNSPMLCLCSRPANICYCQVGQPSRQLVTMTPNFSNQ